MKLLRGFLSVIVLVLVAYLVVARMVHRGFSTRDKPTVIEASLATSMREMAIPSRYKVMKNPAAATPEGLHEAMAHWADHCATCHANNGSGDTMFGKTLYPRPPDMRQRNTQQMSDGELYYIIENGVRFTGMPAWGSGGTHDHDTWHLVLFIRHLPRLTQEDMQDMRNSNPRSPADMKEEELENEFLNNAPEKHSPSKPH